MQRGAHEQSEISASARAPRPPVDALACVRSRRLTSAAVISPASGLKIRASPASAGPREPVARRARSPQRPAPWPRKPAPGAPPCGSKRAALRQVRSHEVDTGSRLPHRRDEAIDDPSSRLPSAHPNDVAGTARVAYQVPLHHARVPWEGHVMNRERPVVTLRATHSRRLVCRKELPGLDP